MKQSEMYGVMGEFESVEGLLSAACQARDAGYQYMDAYTPFPVDGLTEALGRDPTHLQTIVLAGGLLGAILGYLMQLYMAGLNYPTNIGGRPLNSWPAFIPITYELTILFASITALVAMLWLNGLPMPYHPVFNVPEFARAQKDRFFLCVEAKDPRFDPGVLREFMKTIGAQSVVEVPS